MTAPFFDGTQLCAETDPELFFPDKGGSVADAKKVCSRCDFLEPCLEYALTTRIQGIAIAGVWGGTTVKERSDIRRSAGLRLRKESTSVCGTTGGYAAHRRRGEKACAACSDANRIYGQERRARTAAAGRAA